MYAILLFIILCVCIIYILYIDFTHAFYILCTLSNILPLQHTLISFH
nr:MAG TPA: hypothetical protein [Microviridae sp.]